MTTTRTVIVAAALMVAGAASASAQGYGNGYGANNANRHMPDQTDMRQARQSQRIEQGYRDGSLTPREATALADEQRRIAEFERRARFDGHVDPYERARLSQMQNDASRHIGHERRDFEGRNAAFDRPWWRRWW